MHLLLIKERHNKEKRYLPAPENHGLDSSLSPACSLVDCKAALWLARCLTGGEGGCLSYWFQLDPILSPWCWPWTVFWPLTWPLDPSPCEMTGVSVDNGRALMGLLRDEVRFDVWDEDIVAMVARPLSSDDSTGLWVKTKDNPFSFLIWKQRF